MGFRNGEDNPRWNGGVSLYPNHAEMKRNRIDVLKKSKGQCQICGDRAQVVHHIDGSLENHVIDNLLALCNKCHKCVHSQEWNDGMKTSKYIRLYGMTLKQMSNQLNVKQSTIRTWLLNPEKEKWAKQQLGLK